MLRILLRIFLLILALPAAAQDGGNAHYRIDVRLDHPNRLLHGKQTLIWTNMQQQPADELRFHLYWNAFRNDRSTWMIEDRFRKRSSIDDPRPSDWGYLDVRATRMRVPAVAAWIELTDGQRFESPDDGNPHDRTVMVVPLPQPVEPGETVHVEMDWTARVPRTFARTGYAGEYYFIAHWFPKLGVFEPDGWNCHQFHAGTEFFSDFGTYRVAITLPERFVVGATGKLTRTTENDDGTVTHRFTQPNVHGFAWTASPDYMVVEDRFEHERLPAVDLRLLIQPEHRRQAARHLTATKAAIESFGSWYGAYPYGHVTVVDPAHNSNAGGMEYPTLFTCGTQWLSPFGHDSPESVTVHEMGHQYWYGIVGNDEFNHAWIDEGLNTFSTLRTLDERFPPKRYVRRYLRRPGDTTSRYGFLPWQVPGIVRDRFDERLGRYRPSANVDVPSRPTFRQLPGQAGNLTYSKTALWLRTLERHLGWDVLQPAMADFFEAAKFGHPTPEQFFTAIEARAGQELDWFFDQVYDSAAVFDYAIDNVASLPVEPEGWVEGPDGLQLVERERRDESVRYRTEVRVRRLGDGVFPVDVRLVFEDGSEVLRRWDGRSRWTMLLHEGPSKIRYATVDPDRVLMLDVLPSNNTLFRKRQDLFPAIKWASKWLVWLQDRMATFQFYL